MDQEALFPDEILIGEPSPNQAPNQGNGRPRGARNRRHRALEAVARSQAPQLLQRVINAAMNGDMMAAKIVMDRVWPKPRTAPLSVELPEVKTPAELKSAMYDLLQRVAAGELTTDDGAALVAMMKDIFAAELAAGRIDESAPIGPSELTASPKQLLTDRLMKLIESRREAPAKPD